jgi:hypothetical protein
MTDQPVYIGIKLEEQERTMSEIQTPDAPKTGILDSLIKIVFKAEENGFTPDFFEAVKEEINYASAFLKLTPLQTAMFSLFLNRCDDNAILKDDDHTLMISNIVQYANDDGLSEKDHFKLTDEFKGGYLSEIGTKNKIRRKDFIIAEKIPVKNLFYNEKESSQVSELTALLKKENFFSVQDRLSQTGMRRGFACLFYGPPGTGKTETVYQIARATLGKNTIKPIGFGV